MLSKFSIVITTYNRYSLLQRAVSSALAQTVTCEIVVVDDCSTDGTADYLHSLDNKIVFAQNSQNLGHSISVNRGVKMAQGEWIKLLDDDDYLAPNCIEILSQGIIEHCQAVICSCQVAQVNETEVEISRTLPVGFGEIVHVLQKDIHYGMLLERLPFGTPVQVAFCKDAFLESGGWNSNFDLAYDDIDSWSRIAQFGDAIFVNHCLAYRTVWSGGYNRKFSLQKRLEANLLIKEKIYALVNEKYRDVIPPISVISNYLKLHWGLVALKENEFFNFFRMAFPAVLSLGAWKLLWENILAKKIISSFLLSTVAQIIKSKF